MSEFTTHPGIQFEQEAFEPMPAPSKSVRRERPPLITPQTSGLEEMIIELEHKIVDVDPYDFPDAYMQRRNQIIDDVEDKLVWNMAYVKQHVGSKLAHFLVDKRGMHPDKAHAIIEQHLGPVRYAGITDEHITDEGLRVPNSLAEAGSFSSYDRGVRFDGSYAIHTYGSLDGNPDTTAAVLAFSSGIHEYIHGAFESARAVVDGKAVSTRNGLRLVSSQLLEKRQDPIESDDATSIASPTAHTNDLTESSQSQVDQYAVNEYDMSMWLNEATIEYARTKLFGFDVEETAAGYRHGIAVILALERYAGREDVTHARGDEIEATLEGAITGEPVGAMLGRIETVMQHPLAAEKFSHVVNIAAISTINEKEPINDLEFMNMLRAEFHRDELSTEEVNPRSYSNHVDERFFDELRAVMAEHPINPPEKTDALLADKSSTKMRRQRLESQQRVNRFDAASARRANTSGNRFRPAGMNKPAP